MGPKKNYGKRQINVICRQLKKNAFLSSTEPKLQLARPLANIEARTVRRILFYDLDQPARIAALKPDLTKQNKLDILAWRTNWLGGNQGQGGHGMKSSFATRWFRSTGLRWKLAPCPTSSKCEEESPWLPPEEIQETMCWDGPCWHNLFGCEVSHLPQGKHCREEWRLLPADLKRCQAHDGSPWPHDSPGQK